MATDKARNWTPEQRERWRKLAESQQQPRNRVAMVPCDKFLSLLYDYDRIEAANKQLMEIEGAKSAALLDAEVTERKLLARIAELESRIQIAEQASEVLDNAELNCPEVSKETHDADR